MKVVNLPRSLLKIIAIATSFFIKERGMASDQNENLPTVKLLSTQRTVS